MKIKQSPILPIPPSLLKISEPLLFFENFENSNLHFIKGKGGSNYDTFSFTIHNNGISINTTVDKDSSE